MSTRYKPEVKLQGNKIDLLIRPHQPLCGFALSSEYLLGEHTMMFHGELVRRIKYPSPFYLEIILNDYNIEDGEVGDEIDTLLKNEAINSCLITDHKSYIESKFWYMFMALMRNKDAIDYYSVPQLKSKTYDILHEIVFYTNTPCSISDMYYFESGKEPLFVKNRSDSGISVSIGEVRSRYPDRTIVATSNYDRNDAAYEAASQWGIPSAR